MRPLVVLVLAACATAAPPRPLPPTVAVHVEPVSTSAGPGLPPELQPRPPFDLVITVRVCTDELGQVFHADIMEPPDAPASASEDYDRRMRGWVYAP